jgi:hypothetical protein
MAARERDYDDDEDRPRRRTRPTDEFEEGDSPPRKRRRRDEYEDDEYNARPVRRRRPRDDFDEEDDYEDRPRRHRDVAEPSATVTLVGVINLVFAGLAVVWGLAVMFFGSAFMAWLYGAAGDPLLQQAHPNALQAARVVQGFAALGTAMFIGAGFCLMLVGGLPLGLAGMGVLKRQQWGRILTLVLGGFAILGAIAALIQLQNGPGHLILFVIDAAYAGVTYGILLQPQFAEEFE